MAHPKRPPGRGCRAAPRARELAPTCPWANSCIFTYGCAHVLRVCAPLYMWICFVANVYGNIRVHESAQGVSADTSDCVHLCLPIRTRTQPISAEHVSAIYVRTCTCTCMLLPASTHMHTCTPNDQSVAAHSFWTEDRNAARAPSGRDAPFPPDHPTSQRPARPNGPTRLRRTGDKC